MINNKLRKFTETIFCCERFAVVKVANYVLVNVYFPCKSNMNRLLICEELISDIEAWVLCYPANDIIFAIDFNTDLDSSDSVSSHLNSFCQRF